MRGFTGDFYNGHRVFIRSEYEACHRGVSEVDRLGELLGATYDSLVTAMIKAEEKDLSLLYRRHSYLLDTKLIEGSSYKSCWHPYKRGYVHSITGEYVVGELPLRDSYPCWCLRAPGGYNHYNANRMAGDLSALALGIMALFG